MSVTGYTVSELKEIIKTLNEAYLRAAKSGALHLTRFHRGKVQQPFNKHRFHQYKHNLLIGGNY